MKIAFVVINANRHEGTSRAVLEVAERLATNNEVHLWARTINDVKLDNIKWISVSGPARPEVADFLSFKWQVDRRIRRCKYDIVHSAGPNTTFADVYTIQTVHPAKLVSTQAMRANSRVSWLRKASWRLYDRCVQQAERQSYTAYGAKGLRTFVSVSGGTRRELEQNYPRARSDAVGSNLVVVPNGADLELFHPRNRYIHRNQVRKSLGIRQSDFVLIFSGGDWQRKGLDLAIQAISLLDIPSMKLLVVGNDRAGAGVKHLTTQLGMQSRVIFAGFRSDVHRYYSAADVFLFPTAYEAFSVASIEAAASGLPILMSDASGAEELIGTGATGEIISRVPTEIAESILNFFASPQRLIDCGNAARQLAEKAFGWDSITARTYDIYESLLDQRMQMMKAEQE